MYLLNRQVIETQGHEILETALGLGRRNDENVGKEMDEQRLAALLLADRLGAQWLAIDAHRQQLTFLDPQAARHDKGAGRKVAGHGLVDRKELLQLLGLSLLLVDVVARLLHLLQCHREIVVILMVLSYVNEEQQQR